MNETRVKKYKSYRDSMIKVDSIPLDTSSEVAYDNHFSDSNATTSALPLEQVMGNLEEDQKEALFLRKKLIRKILIIVGIALGVAAVIALIVRFGIFVFSK